MVAEWLVFPRLMRMGASLVIIRDLALSCDCKAAKYGRLLLASGFGS